MIWHVIVYPPLHIYENGVCPNFSSPKLVDNWTHALEDPLKKSITQMTEPTISLDKIIVAP